MYGFSKYSYVLTFLKSLKCTKGSPRLNVYLFSNIIQIILVYRIPGKQSKGSDFGGLTANSFAPFDLREKAVRITCAGSEKTEKK